MGFIEVYKGIMWTFQRLEARRFLVSFLSLPVRKPFIYAGFRLSLYFYYTLFTPFFQLWV